EPSSDPADSGAHAKGPTREPLGRVPVLAPPAAFVGMGKAEASPRHAIWRDDIKPGDEDGFGNTLKTMIYRTPTFCVWIVEGSYDVWWHYEPEELPQGLSAITSRAAQLEAVQIQALSNSARLAFRCLIGEGIARALEGDMGAASSTLDAAEAFVKARLEERARTWHLVIALIAGVLAVLALTGIGLFDKCGGFRLCEEVPVEPVYCGLMGIFGAVFSVASRANKISADPAAGFP